MVNEPQCLDQDMITVTGLFAKIALDSLLQTSLTAVTVGTGSSTVGAIKFV